MSQLVKDHQHPKLPWRKCSWCELNAVMDSLKGVSK